MRILPLRSRSKSAASASFEVMDIYKTLKANALIKKKRKEKFSVTVKMVFTVCSRASQCRRAVFSGADGWWEPKLPC